jgi:hypothetical protein
MQPEEFPTHQEPWSEWAIDWVFGGETPEWVIDWVFGGETRASLADFTGQTLGIDEECRAQRMIECCNWEEN